MTIYKAFTGGHRCRGGALMRMLLFVAVLFAALTLAWILFLPAALKSVVKKRTGFEVQVTKLSVNPFGGNVSLSGLDISNPKEWPSSDFVKIREFTAETDLWSLFSSRPVIDNAVVDVELVAVVTDRQGKTNLQLFQERLAPPKDSKQKAPPSDKKQEFLIRQLRLRFDKLSLVDYSEGKAAPSRREFNVNLDRTYKDVTDPKQILTGSIPGLSAIGSALSALVPGTLGKAIGSAIKDPDELLKSTGKKAGEVFRGLLEKLEEKPKP